MSKAYIVDTNIFIRYFTHDNPLLAQKAADLINSANKLIIADAVFLEIGFVLSKIYFFTRDQIQVIFDTLASIENAVVSKYMKEAIGIFRANTNLDLTDCILISKAKEENLELVTFDKAMLKYYKQLTK